MSETGAIAVGLIDGDKPYQKRARLALPILVRQAMAHRTMFYSDLAAELRMSNPRTLNYPLGAIGNAMLDLSEKWGKSIPPIQAVVINKSTHLPGDGLAWFAPDPESYRSMSRQDRQLVVRHMLQNIFTYSDWHRVLKELGLQPAPRIPLPPVADVFLQSTRGEGTEHRALKNAIAQNPSWIGLPKRLGPGNIETRLYSGDSLDILFTDSKRWTAVEVKGRSASRSEIVRGFYQCVKYEALLNAQARVSGYRLDCEAVLALGGMLPQDLLALRHTLGVRVFECVDESVSHCI